MSRYTDLMIEIEDSFFSKLNDDGMTNEQAIKKIKAEYGEDWENFIRDIIKREEN